MTLKASLRQLGTCLPSHTNAAHFQVAELNQRLLEYVPAQQALVQLRNREVGTLHMRQHTGLRK